MANQAIVRNTKDFVKGKVLLQKITYMISLMEERQKAKKFLPIPSLSGSLFIVASLMFGIFVTKQANSLPQQSVCDTLRTQTPGGWGAAPAGNNPGTYLHNNFVAAFPNGLHVGCNDSLVLTSAQSVTDFLPSGGSPSTLPSGTLTNPTSHSNTLAGHVVTLKLSITFDKYDPGFGSSPINLEDLTVTQGTFAGWTVSQVFAEANKALGGCNSSYSLSQLTDAVTAINENFVDGQLTGNYLSCPFQLAATTTDVQCYGDSTGSIDLTINGGIAPYTYSWSNGDTTEDLANVPAGIYSVTVTDDVGLTATTSDTIVQPSQITTQVSVTDVSCNGSCDGSVSLTVNGGTPPYTYNWSNGSSNQDLSSICAGHYDVTITDANGCVSQVDNIKVTEPPLLVASAAVSSDYNGQDISCFGANDGEAQVNGSGGTGSYSYHWSNGQTSQTATGLSAGTYGVTITDANGCEATDSVTLTQPDPVTASVTPTSQYNGYNISCHGGSDGSAEITASGGTPPYTYQWDANAGGQTSAEATNLSAGTYSVTVTDVNGCIESGSVTLTEPPVLNVDAGDSKTVYYGYPDSACTDLVVQSSSGGVPPYSYSWSNGAPSDSIHVCPSTTTTYTVTITDQNGCTDTSNVKVCVIDVRCGNPNQNKVELCHMISNPPVTICVSVNAVQTHLDHGDLLGGCNVSSSCDGQISEKRGGNQSQSGTHNISTYPNPFSTETNIKFSISNDGVAILELYDMSGKKIKQLYQSEVSAGQTYSTNVDMRQLTPGLYFCKFQFPDGTTNTKKLLLIPGQ